MLTWFWLGFFHSKESACNAGDPFWMPGSGSSPGEGIGYPLQYCWASLMAQLVKNPHAMWETWVWSLSWEDALEKRKATHSIFLVWGIPWTIQSMVSQRVGHNWATFTFTMILGTLVIADCWGPAPVDPGNLKGRQCRRSGNNRLIKY